MELAATVAQWSRDPSTQVGAVIVGSDKEILSMGYNGFPRGMKDLPERYENKEFKHRHVIHAEENALINASRGGAGVKGATLYVTHAPCQHCAGVIVQAGIEKVVFPQPEPAFAERYRLEDTLAMFAECGVGVSVLLPVNGADKRLQ